MNLENILSGRRQNKRSCIAWSHLYEISRICKSLATECISDCPGLGVWGMGVTDGWCGVSFWSDASVLKLIMVIVLQLCEYTKNYWIVHYINGLIYGLSVMSQCRCFKNSKWYHSFAQNSQLASFLTDSKSSPYSGSWNPPVVNLNDLLHFASFIPL